MRTTPVYPSFDHVPRPRQRSRQRPAPAPLARWCARSRPRGGGGERKRRPWGPFGPVGPDFATGPPRHPAAIQPSGDFVSWFVVVCVVTLPSLPGLARLTQCQSVPHGQERGCFKPAWTLAFCITSCYLVSFVVDGQAEFATRRSAVRSRSAPPRKTIT
jgi:hypothetical protein